MARRAPIRVCWLPCSPTSPSPSPSPSSSSSSSSVLSFVRSFVHRQTFYDQPTRSTPHPPLSVRAQSFDKRATSISRGWKDRDGDNGVEQQPEKEGENTREHRGISEQKGEERTAKVKRREASHAAYAQTFLSFTSTPRRPLPPPLTCEFTNNRTHPPDRPDSAALTRMFGRKRPERRSRFYLAEEQPFRRVGGQGCFSLCNKFHISALSTLCTISARTSFFTAIFQVARRRY